MAVGKPYAPVYVDPQGNLFVTTTAYGQYNQGGIIEISPSPHGKFTATALYNFCSPIGFCSDGNYAMADLIPDAQGNLYAPRCWAASAIKGTIYKLVPDGQASQHSVLYSFCTHDTCDDGRWAQRGALTMDSAGNLFGTTKWGGIHHNDPVTSGGGPCSNSTARTRRFTISAPGTNCSDGQEPTGGLVMTPRQPFRYNQLWRPTIKKESRGAGTIFELTPVRAHGTRALALVCPCCSRPDGRNPRRPTKPSCARCIPSAPKAVAPTAANRPRAWWRTAPAISTARRCSAATPASGVAFELIPNARKTKYKYKRLYSFCAQANCADGNDPDASLIIDASGGLYGTTMAGGASDGGVVFELKPKRGKWTYTVLIPSALPPIAPTAVRRKQAFPTRERNRERRMTARRRSTARRSRAGANKQGVAFKLTPGAPLWTEQVLYAFCAVSACADGASPAAGLTVDGSGHLFGTTYYGGSANMGTVFELSGGSEFVLHSFCTSSNCADGAFSSGPPCISTLWEILPAQPSAAEGRASIASTSE